MNLHLILPEIVVVAGGMLAVAVDLLAPASRKGRAAPWVAGLALLAATLLVVLGRPEGTSFFGHHRSDAFSRFVRAVATGGGVLLVLISAPYTVNNQVIGTLGVIGPSRMAYDRVIPLVDVTAKLLSRAMQNFS